MNNETVAKQTRNHVDNELFVTTWMSAHKEGKSLAELSELLDMKVLTAKTKARTLNEKFEHAGLNIRLPELTSPSSAKRKTDIFALAKLISLDNLSQID